MQGVDEDDGGVFTLEWSGREGRGEDGVRGDEVEEGGFAGEGRVVGVWGGNEFEDVRAFFCFSYGVRLDGGAGWVWDPCVVVRALVVLLQWWWYRG